MKVAESEDAVHASRLLSGFDGRGGGGGGVVSTRSFLCRIYETCGLTVSILRF